MKTRTVLTRYTTTLSKPTKRQPSCMYHINLGARRSHYRKTRRWSRREAPYKMFSKAPVKVSPIASEVEDAKKDLDRAYAFEQDEYFKSKIQEIERAYESYETSLAWSIVNQIPGRKESSRCRICASCPKERIKLWKEHFEGLLGQPSVVDDQQYHQGIRRFAHQDGKP